jgi:hypothetical protein
VLPLPALLVGDAMTLQEIVNIVGNRIAALRNQRAVAVLAGDLIQVNAIDAEIAQTQMTLDQLLSLV